MKGIVAPEIGPKSFRTFEGQAVGLNFSGLSLATASVVLITTAVIYIETL